MRSLGGGAALANHATGQGLCRLDVRGVVERHQGLQAGCWCVIRRTVQTSRLGASNVMSAG